MLREVLLIVVLSPAVEEFGTYFRSAKYINETHPHTHACMNEHTHTYTHTHQHTHRHTKTYRKIHGHTQRDRDV